MFIYQTAALAIYALGRLQEDVGRMVGNKNMQSIGYGRQITGRAKKAIGEADMLIKRCKGSLPNPSFRQPTVNVDAIPSRQF